MSVSSKAQFVDLQPINSQNPTDRLLAMLSAFGDKDDDDDKTDNELIELMKTIIENNSNNNNAYETMTGLLGHNQRLTEENEQLHGGYNQAVEYALKLEKMLSDLNNGGGSGGGPNNGTNPGQGDKKGGGSGGGPNNNTNPGQGDKKGGGSGGGPNNGTNPGQGDKKGGGSGGGPNNGTNPGQGDKKGGESDGVLGFFIRKLESTQTALQKRRRDYEDKMKKMRNSSRYKDRNHK